MLFDLRPSVSSQLRLLLLAIVLCALTTNASAQTDHQIEDGALRIEKNLLSPFCPGRLLYDCPTERASKLKVQIREMLSQGNSENEVISVIQSEYPDALLAAPEARGLGLLAWLIPGALVAIATLLSVRWLLKQQPLNHPR